jgi:hypothetical protein
VQKISFLHIITSLLKKIVILLLLITSIHYKTSAQNNSDTVIIEQKADYDDEEEEQDAPATTKKEEYFQQKDETEPYSVTQRNLPRSFAKKLKEDSDFWYADAKEKKQKTTPVVTQGSKGENGKVDIPKERQPTDEVIEEIEYTPVSQRHWFKTFLWILVIVGFIAIVALYLSSSGVGFFRRKDKAIQQTSVEEEMPEDIFAINYQKEIDKAAAQGNYRLAIRLQYLRMLKNMAERNIIHYKQDKTNLDYMMELQPTAYYTNFFRTTRHYEYSWYGKFDVKEETYHSIRRGFDDFEKQIQG